MLPAWRNPSFSSPELTHVVSSAAPSGVIDGDGTGRPTTRAEHNDLTLLPRKHPSVQRSVAQAVPADEPAPSLTRTSTASLPVLQLAPVEAPAAPESATPQPAEAPEAADAEDVAPSEPDPPTVEPAPAVPGPALQRSAAAAGPRRYGLGAPLPSMPTATAPRGPAVQRSVDESVVRPPPATAGAAPSPVEATPTVTPDPPAPAAPSAMPLAATPSIQRHEDQDTRTRTTRPRTRTPPRRNPRPTRSRNRPRRPQPRHSRPSRRRTCHRCSAPSRTRSSPMSHRSPGRCSARSLPCPLRHRSRAPPYARPASSPRSPVRRLRTLLREAPREVSCNVCSMSRGREPCAPTLPRVVLPRRMLPSSGRLTGRGLDRLDHPSRRLSRRRARR